MNTRNILSCNATAAGQIAHAVAHPFTVLTANSILGIWSCSFFSSAFRGINGLRDALLSDLAQALFNQLTPEKIEAFANRHNLAPTHAEPWKKIFVGGRTITRAIRRVGFYGNSSGEIRGNIPRMRPQGRLQRARPWRHPLLFPTVFIIRLPVSSRIASMKSSARRSLVGENVFAVHGSRAPTEFTLKRKWNSSCRAFVGKIFDFVKPANVSLWNELSGYFGAGSKSETGAQLNGHEPERRTFLMANMVAEQLTFRFSRIRSANSWRQHGREHAGSERDCADPGDSTPTSMVS